MLIRNPSIVTSLRVYYEDTDAGGVVYHANYLRYAERARTEALRDAGIPHADLVERFGLMFVVHRAEIDYVRPAMLDDLLVVETETMDVGGATVLLRQTVSGPAGVCATSAHQAGLRPNRRKQTGPNPGQVAGGAGSACVVRDVAGSRSVRDVARQKPNEGN